MGTQTKSWKKTIFKIILVLVVLGAGAFWVYFYYPYGASSVKAGQLNYVMYKGVVFKTYEGKLIQTGIKAAATGGVQSNEFEFSVEDKALAEKLMNMAGQNVKLHYKEYFGALPWRGYTRYIVDSIVSVEDANPNMNVDPNLLINY
ncbi:hypothetical protein [Dysgonomonas macrotermitis]|uniref:6-phosphogluconate dehydrogenase n=1 Tax=Dysgonomonas macrotermitis TaxID=1346286 RepID=A0A1M5D5B0_9BACT|nr:hypothetical protein [Dysgonomonas macrotermitis]SHF62161.1 hypothetical protein SAMN05444362_10881 [Dysgonomonas macrotermitis]